MKKFKYKEWMKMTLKQKRGIVRRFKEGESSVAICVGNVKRHCICRPIDGKTGDSDFDLILRDYINGKFTLAPKRKATK